MYNNGYNKLDRYSPLFLTLAHHQRLIEERQRDRLAHQASRSQNSSIPLANRVVGQVGRELITIGCALQRRAGTDKVGARS